MLISCRLVEYASGQRRLSADRADRNRAERWTAPSTISGCVRGKNLTISSSALLTQGEKMLRKVWLMFDGSSFSPSFYFKRNNFFSQNLSINSLGVNSRVESQKTWNCWMHYNLVSWRFLASRLLKVTAGFCYPDEGCHFLALMAFQVGAFFDHFLSNQLKIHSNLN